MQEKYYDFTSSIVIGVVLIILGNILLVGNTYIYKNIVSIFIFVMWLKVIKQVISMFFKKEENNNITLSSCLLNLVICLILSTLPNFAIGIVPFIFSIYLIIIGIIQLIMFLLSIKNKTYLELKRLLVGLIYLLIALPILLSPVRKLHIFIICFSTYMILLGLSYTYTAITGIIPIKTKNKIKRRIKITLPKLIEAIIPYVVMQEINKSLEVQNNYNYSYLKKDKKPDINILIHTSTNGFNRMGHIDIYYNNQVISYGNYDEGSRIGGQLFGDGIIFTTEKKKEYINFCIDNSKKTIFDFGLVLTDKQKEQVSKKIEKLLSNTIIWNHKTDKSYNNGNSYAGKLYKKTSAKFYKIKKGKYKTYFVIGTNCCFLADEIIGSFGMDILSINGIITPGTYYDHLNRLFNQKNSNVISKEIYNYDRRA